MNSMAILAAATSRSYWANRLGFLASWLCEPRCLADRICSKVSTRQILERGGLIWVVLMIFFNKQGVDATSRTSRASDVYASGKSLIYWVI